MDLHCRAQRRGSGSKNGFIFGIEELMFIAIILKGCLTVIYKPVWFQLYFNIFKKNFKSPISVLHYPEPQIKTHQSETSV